MKIYVNHKYKFVYFMIFKNASSSIRYLIFQNLQNKKDLKYDIDQLAAIPVITLKKLSEYEDYFWFIFFRNPYDRVVSAYHDKVLGLPNDQIYEGLYNPNLHFNDFIKQIIKIPDDKIDIHLRSQTFKITHLIPKMNFIGTIENFDHDIREIKRIFNLSYEPVQLRKTKKLELDDQLKAKIYKRYKQDFEIFKKINLNYN